MSGCCHGANQVLSVDSCDMISPRVKSSQFFLIIGRSYQQCKMCRIISGWTASMTTWLSVAQTDEAQRLFCRPSCQQKRALASVPRAAQTVSQSSLRCLGWESLLGTIKHTPNYIIYLYKMYKYDIYQYTSCSLRTHTHTRIGVWASSSGAKLSKSPSRRPSLELPVVLELQRGDFSPTSLVCFELPSWERTAS